MGNSHPMTRVQVHVSATEQTAELLSILFHDALGLLVFQLLFRGLLEESISHSIDA